MGADRNVTFIDVGWPPGIQGTNFSQYAFSNITDNCTNCSAVDPHTSHAASQVLGPATERIFYIIYILAIVLGAGGNLTSIIVFTNGRRCNTDIRGFLINLAVADLIMAIICLPFSFTTALLREWIFSAPMCPIISFTQMLSVNVSVYTNTAISIDRFLAIKYPLKLLRTSRKHVHWVIGVVWIVSAAICAVQLWVSQVITLPDGTLVCTENWPQSDSGIDFRKWYTLLVLIITYIIPVIFIITMYGLVCIQLWIRTTPGVLNQARGARQLSVKQKVVKMLMTMSVLFTLCWMPLHIFFLIMDYTKLFDSVTQRDLTIIYFCVNWLAMSNSFQNPIIYGFLNDNFRADLAEMLLKCCPRLSKIKSLQRAALYNKPLSRLSTRMTLMAERGDSRADLNRHRSQSRDSNSDSHLNSIKRQMSNQSLLRQKSLSSSPERDETATNPNTCLTIAEERTELNSNSMPSSDRDSDNICAPLLDKDSDLCDPLLQKISEVTNETN